MADQTTLEDRLGYRFKDRSLFELALTHRSVIAESQVGVAARTAGGGQISNQTNERLEFLGDRVLGLAVVHLLLESFPDEAEGQLAQRFAALVSAKTLQVVAASLDLASHIKIGTGMAVADTMTSDACEALIGAIYLDADFETAHGVVVRHWQDLMDATAHPPKDAKTTLQEWVQERGLPLPQYELAERSGPDHEPEFTMSVTIDEHPPVTGTGTSKRAAAQKAAEAMLKILQ